MEANVSGVGGNKDRNRFQGTELCETLTLSGKESWLAIRGLEHAATCQFTF